MINYYFKNLKRVAKKVLRLPEVLGELWSEYRSRLTWHTKAEIQEYRKTIKVYDIFNFFNEFDLLEIRLNMLDKYVDYFVLSEATLTFSGDKKPLNFQLNRDRFKKWEHKIIYNPITDVPETEEEILERLNDANLSSVDRDILENCRDGKVFGTNFTWVREFYIKECAKRSLTKLNDNDICYVSDLDEFWNPELVIDFIKDSVFKPIQTAYIYFLNNRSDENWHGWSGTIVTKYKNVKNGSLNKLRTHKEMVGKYIFLRDGGWHFSFQGGYEGAMKKIKESNHVFYKGDKTLPTLQKMVAKNIDYQGRNFKFWIDEKNLPKYILENKDKYIKFFKQ